MTGVISDREVLAYLECLSTVNTRDATRLALGLVEQVGLASVVTALLSSAQVEVGRRWQVNEWSVAQEHAATAITEDVLAALVRHAPTDKSPVPDRRPVVVACVEGEWHSLPARMAAHLLSHLGWSVVFLGASTPADQLRRYLAQVDAAALGVSCTVPLFLHGALRSIRAGQAAGVPVLASGRAFGSDDRRAARLGADHWAESIGTANDRLQHLDERRLESEPANEAAWFAIEAARTDVVRDAMQSLTASFAPLSAFDDRQLEQTEEGLNCIVSHLAISMLVDDPSTFRGLKTWLAAVLSAREVPDEALTAGLRALQSALRVSAQVPGETLTLLED